MTFPDILQLIIDFFTNQTLIVKIVLSILIALYGLFAVVLAVQIRVLATVISQNNITPLLKLIAFLHVLFVFGLLVATVFLI